MRYTFLIGLLLAQFTAKAQQFAKNQEVILPDSIVQVTSQGADLDNDGLLDVLLLAENSRHENFLMYIRGDTVNPLVLSSANLRLPAFGAYTLEDYDNNNEIDLILSPSSGQFAVLYLNKGDFVFQAVDLSLPSFDVMKFADLDHDGKEECVVSGTRNGSFFTTTYSASGNDWSVQSDSMNILLQDLQMADFNSDGLTDVFYSGRDQVTDSVCSVVMIQSEKGFVEAMRRNVHSKSILTDLDNSGTLDIIFFGKDRRGNSSRHRCQWQNDEFAVDESVTSDNVISGFWADLNSDGIVDENLVTVNALNEVLNKVTFTNEGGEVLPASNFQGQYFADVEHDGDLDLVQITKGQAISLSIYINTEQDVNIAPARPAHAIAVPVYNRIYLYWEKSEDDHTPENSITYDLYMEGKDVNSSSEFDLINEKRLTVSHGNNGTLNFKLIKAGIEGFHYAIQSVDNSLHAGEDGSCSGGIECVNASEETIITCKDEPIKLTSPETAIWFSFSRGFLGQGSVIETQASSNDTVFYFLPDYQTCSTLRTFPIEIQNSITMIQEDVIECKGAAISLSVPTEWDNVKWKSDKYGDIGSGSPFEYVLQENDLVRGTYQKSESCSLIKEYAVTVSTPVITIQPSQVKILAGSKVDLLASGAKTYKWSPTTNLNNPNISSPSATPDITTQYFVVGTDSIGCEGMASVTIYVEHQGFIPSLFTPNADGKNDQLKVYGIASVNSFSFRIYNRDGSTVYKTTNSNEAEHQGWDGTTNGVQQPNGVYYWQIDGLIGTRELLLNGKKHGSFLLVR
jgi:gliding motility-associated-like protein